MRGLDSAKLRLLADWCRAKWRELEPSIAWRKRNPECFAAIVELKRRLVLVGLATEAKAIDPRRLKAATPACAELQKWERFLTNSASPFSDGIDSQTTLRQVLRPRFDRLAGAIRGVLLEISKDFPEEQARKECPSLAPKDFLAGGDYGNSGRKRLFALKTDDRELLSQFQQLAEDAGNCVGAWARDLGVSPDSIAERFASSRWVYTLFDLALRKHPRFPMDPGRTLYGNIGMWFKGMKLVCTQPPEPKATELKEEIRQLASLGWYAALADVCRASVYGIDVLTAAPAVVDPPPKATHAEAVGAEDATTAQSITARRKAKPSDWLAYSQYDKAIKQNAELDGANDDAVYDWLSENLDDVKLPHSDTWKRQLRNARRAAGTQKHARRAGRAHGGSIVERNDI